MPTGRMLRVNELIKRVLAEDFYKELGGGGFDLAAVTIVRVNTSPDLRDAYVYVSIFGHQDERERMLQKLQDHRITFQHNLSRQIKLRYTPRLCFRLDDSIEKGDHVLSLLAQMEQDAAPRAEKPPEAPERQTE